MTKSEQEIKTSLQPLSTPNTQCEHTMLGYFFTCLNLLPDFEFIQGLENVRRRKHQEEILAELKINL